MRPKGSEKTPGSGRRKGTANKTTAELRDMVMNALSAAGGENYLREQAEENPTAFMALVGKCLPKDVNLQGDATITLTIERSYVKKP